MTTLPSLQINRLTFTIEVKINLSLLRGVYRWKFL